MINHKFLRFVTFLLGCLSFQASASLFENIESRVSGFGTLALVHGGDDELGFRKSLANEGAFGDWQLESDSVLGLQLDTNYSDRLSSTLQLVAKSRLSDRLSDNLEWGFFRYDKEYGGTVRIGRLALGLFMMSEYKDVGLAYNWVRPPVEMYGLLPLFNFDGIDYNYPFTVNDNRLELKVGLGQSEILVDLQGVESDVDIDAMAISTLSYYVGDAKFRLTAASARLQTIDSDALDLLVENLAPIPGFESLINAFTIDGDWVNYFSLGYQQQWQSWLLLAEATYLDSKTPIFLSSRSGYIHLGKRVDNLTFYSTISTVRNVEKPYEVVIPSGTSGPLLSLLQGAQSLVKMGEMGQDTLSIGTRWDIYPTVAVKFQWDRSWIPDNKAFLWDRRAAGDSVMDTFTINVSFTF